MRTTLNRALSVGLLAAALAAAAPASAHDYTAGALKIAHPWSRATPGGAKVAAGYLSVTNTGAEPDRLTGGAIEAAGRGELHSMSTEGGVMRMAPVEGGLAIKPGETLRLGPGGYHLMFLDLKAPLKKGEMVKGTLTFEKAGSVPVAFKVEGIAAREPDEGGGAHDHPHDDHHDH